MPCILSTSSKAPLARRRKAAPSPLSIHFAMRMEEPTHMADVLRAGLVGCGSLSQRGVLPHLSLPDAREKIQLVAVVDAVEERARQSAERFNVPAYFTDIETMLAQADVDVVLVITPITYHYANAMAAFAAGKHVYVQKAMTTTL